MVLYFCNILKTVREFFILFLEMHSQHNNASLCKVSTKSQLVKLSLTGICTCTIDLFKCFFEIFSDNLCHNEWKWMDWEAKTAFIAKLYYSGPVWLLVVLIGGKDRQYSTLTVRFPWETCKKTLYSHRFSYMIFNRVFDLSKDIHVSHICHQRRCINPAHLSYEPRPTSLSWYCASTV